MRARFIFYIRGTQLEQILSVCGAALINYCIKTQLYSLIWVKLDHILWGNYIRVFPVMSSSICPSSPD